MIKLQDAVTSTSLRHEPRNLERWQNAYSSPMHALASKPRYSDWRDLGHAHGLDWEANWLGRSIPAIPPCLNLSLDSHSSRASRFLLTPHSLGFKTCFSGSWTTHRLAASSFLSLAVWLSLPPLHSAMSTDCIYRRILQWTDDTGRHAKRCSRRQGPALKQSMNHANRIEMQIIASQSLVLHTIINTLAIIIVMPTGFLIPKPG